MEIKITIPVEVSAYVQALFLKYTAISNLLQFLTSQSDTQLEWIEYYNQEYFNYNNELELAKSKIVYTYCPPGLTNFDYVFDFENSMIIYINKEG